ncbi:MAG: DNA internalization-related competence protein ComEC/Rec2 [Gammaproteobacteria bacterium]
MRTGTIAFLSGILLLLRCPALPPAYFLMLLFPLVFLLIAAGPRLRLAGWLLCGFTWALIRAQGMLAPELDRELEGKTLTVTGQVSSLSESRERGTRFEFRLDGTIRFAGRDWPAPGKIRLSWYQNPPQLLPGQYWQLTIRLKRPRGFSNPGGFDYEGWLFQHRIRAVGYVVQSPVNHYTGTIRGAFIDRLRYALREGVNRNLDSKYRGLIIALTLGDRSQTATADRATMINTGTYHLLAISGLHISLVAGLLYLAFLKLWSGTGRWAVRLPAPKIAAAVAMLGAACYALVSGFSIPVQRALIMLVVIMCVVYSGRRHAVSHVIAVALLLVLIYDPFAVLDPGFWLSFGAIGVLAWGMSCRISVRSLWWKWGRAQYVVFVGLLPLSLLWFQQYALHGIFANIVAIPWISLVTTPLALAGVALVGLNAPLGHFFLMLAGMTLQLIWPALEKMGQWHLAVFHQAAPSWWTLAMGLIGALILLLPAGISWRWLGIVWLLPLLLPLQKTTYEGELRFALLDVGQGLAAVVETRTHTLVYDTGARFSEDFNAGTSVVVPYLRQTGVTHLDKLIISHGDNDHSGGAEAILAAYPDTGVLSSVPAPLAHPNWSPCIAGQKWQWDGVHFQILYPEKTEPGKDNNQSCVLKISTARYSILLPGDIEKEAEYRLLHSHSGQLSAEVLVAPHHGSKTSSTTAFIEAVHPRLVLFPVGYRNRFRFPNQDIMRRYEMQGVRSYDTARHGAILIRIDQSGINTTAWRHEARRFWHTRN